MFPHSGFERRRCLSQFASLCLASVWPLSGWSWDHFIFSFSTPAPICMQTTDRHQGHSDRLQRCSVDLNVQCVCSLQRNEQGLEMKGKRQMHRYTAVLFCVLNRRGRTKQFDIILCPVASLEPMGIHDWTAREPTVTLWRNTSPCCCPIHWLFISIQSRQTTLLIYGKLTMEQKV